MNNNDQTGEYMRTLNKNLPNNSNSEMILPRRGWQDKKSLLKVIIKAKRSLDIAEISHFLD